MRNSWTRENIIRYLLEREAKGLSLTIGGDGVDKSMYASARRIFGSWQNAKQAAGIVPQQARTWEHWSPTRILMIIRQLARRRRPLTMDQVNQRYPNLASAARRHFGSWTKAVLAADVEPTKLQRVVPWNPQRVIEAILTRALRNESLVARLVEPRSLVEAGKRFFGDWPAAVAAAGLDPASTLLAPRRNKPPELANARAMRSKPVHDPRQPWTKERIIAALQDRLRQQKPMHSTAIARQDPRLYNAIRRHLRNWKEAMRAAGLEPDTYRRGLARPFPAPEAGLHDPVSCQSQAKTVLRLDHPA